MGLTMDPGRTAISYCLSVSYKSTPVIAATAPTLPIDAHTPNTTCVSLFSPASPSEE